MNANEVDVVTAAGRLGISPRTVERKFRAGKLVGRFVEGEKGGGSQGKKLLIKIEELRNLGIEELGKEMQASADSSPALAGGQAEFLSSFSPSAPLLPSPQPSLARGEGGTLISPARGEGESNALMRAYPVKYQRLAAMRREALVRFRMAQTTQEKTAMIILWNLENPLFKTSLASLYRLDAAMREFLGEDGEERAILESPLQSPLHPRWESGNSSSVPDEPFGYFKKLFLTQQCRSGQICVDLLRLQYPDIPSSGCFLRRLAREMPSHIIYYYRRGPAAYDRKFGSCAERDYSTVAPGQMYVMDHHQVDVAVLGRDGRPFFPWSTVCADIRSRKYLGWAICPQPNSDTIHLAFRRACLRFGVPKELLVDNGKDFRSRLFAGGLRRIRLRLDEVAEKALIYQLGVQPHFALPYNAKSKPIERSFLTIKERFSRLLPTFRGGDITERPEELAELINSGKSVPIAQFEHLYAGWVEAEFNNHPHRGHGMDGRSPNEVFGQGNVARQVDAELLSLLLLKNSRPSIVGKNGVTLFNRGYFAEPLLMLKGQAVYLRYDPDEIGRVWIYTMKDEFICQAEERELMAWHATEEQTRAANSIKKKEKNLIRSYHEMRHDRAKEPDLLKALIAKKAQECGTDLREGTLHPEKPLLAGMRMSQRERERMQEEEEEARQTLGERISRPPEEEEREENPYDEHLKRYFGIA